jgi:serine/threonine protein kinase
VSVATGTGGPTAVPNFPSIPGVRILALAGQGGMGTVYRAEQAVPRRIVAVKVLNQAAASPDRLAAFHREAETIARLEHPNILPVYGYGEAGGRPFLLLRYMGGGSVATLIRKGPIALPDAVRWVRAMADALDFAHAHGLVHRDVKPSNMLLDEAGNVYLTDFGIAAATEATQTENTTGSAAYMSPEQGSGQRADRRSDIYSLAVSLFEMLTAQLPYTAETPLGIVVRHINDPVPSARALNPNIPPAVDALIQRGMAKDPAARPQSAGEFGRLLESAAAQNAAEPLPTLVSPEPPAAAAAPAARGGAHPLLWPVIGLAAACLLGAFLLGGGGALMAIINAARATSTPLPSSTTPPTFTPAAPTPPGQLLADNFSDPSSGFGLRTIDAAGGIAESQGALRFTVLRKDVEWYSTSGRVKQQDVKIEVIAQQTSGPPLTEFGAICRWQDAKNFTAFAISAGGQYRIWQKANGNSLPLVGWTDAPSLAGAGLKSHRLTVTCAGTQLSLAVDGTLLGQAEDSAPVAGDVALFAGLREAGSLAVDFKSVKVIEP